VRSKVSKGVTVSYTGGLVIPVTVSVIGLQFGGLFYISTTSKIWNFGHLLPAFTYSALYHI
jgi:hypothetical protein